MGNKELAKTYFSCNKQTFFELLELFSCPKVVKLPYPIVETTPY